MPNNKRAHDKNIKGNILSFENFMIYEFCFVNKLLRNVDVNMEEIERYRRILFAIFVAACYTTSNLTTVERGDRKFQIL